MKKKKSIQLINSIKYLIIKKNLLQINKSLILAISGGQDSICLLIIFYILKKQWNINLIILNCNHLWNIDSVYIESHLSKISFCLQIQIYFFPTFKVLQSEEKSRYWRSKTYSRLLYFTKCSTIVTAHTLSDQIETFLFNTIRGCGLHGTLALKLEKNFSINNTTFNISKNNFTSLIILKSTLFSKTLNGKINFILISKKNYFFFENKNKLINFEKKKFFIIKKNLIKKRLLRPLLKKTRFDIKNLCNLLKLPLFPDQSNQETKYSRNRLRKQVLPTLRFFFNKKIDYILLNYNEILFEEEQYSEKLITKIYLSLINEDNNGYFINLRLFNSLPLTFQRQICFSLFKEKLFLNFKFSTIDNFITLIKEYNFKIKKQINIKNTNSKLYYIFFPEIGTIYISKYILIIFK